MTKLLITQQLLTKAVITSRVTRLVTMALLSSLVVFGGCIQAQFQAPQASIIQPPPQAVTIIQLCQDYISSPVNADSRYVGKRLAFSQVKVEKVSRLTNQNAEAYITAGDVKFKPKYSIDLDSVVEDTIVDIVGECQGIMWGYVFIRDCWIKIVGGPVTVRAGY